jgi:DNA-3-methyladenine glycosylase II
VSNPSTYLTLTHASYLRGISQLSSQDSGLAWTLSKWGNPPFWTHPRGFPGIVIAILGQQVSIESADAAFNKLKAVVGKVTPESVLSLDDAPLEKVGFSRQKASYVRGVAQGIIDGDIDLQELVSVDNEEARERLVQIRGIGAWTADTYLLFALRRQDAWPMGDLALAKAIQEVRKLPKIPSPEEADGFAQSWKPWRAVAARILWHHYLCERGRDASA